MCSLLVIQWIYILNENYSLLRFDAAWIINQYSVVSQYIVFFVTKAVKT